MNDSENSLVRSARRVPAAAVLYCWVVYTVQAVVGSCFGSDSSACFFHSRTLSLSASSGVTSFLTRFLGAGFFFAAGFFVAAVVAFFFFVAAPSLAAVVDFLALVVTDALVAGRRADCETENSRHVARTTGWVRGMANCVVRRTRRWAAARPIIVNIVNVYVWWGKLRSRQCLAVARAAMGRVEEARGSRDRAMFGSGAGQS